MVGIVYRNICVKYKLETPRSKWESSPKMEENDRVKILWDFQIQTNKMVIPNQTDIVIIDKKPRTAVAIDVAIPEKGTRESVEIPRA